MFYLPQTRSQPIPRAERKIYFNRAAKGSTEIVSCHDFARIPEFPKATALLPSAAPLLYSTLFQPEEPRALP